jgi:hypothetical protein
MTATAPGGASIPAVSSRAKDPPIWMQPTKFELVTNRQTAKTLSIEIPLILLAIADEVID